MAKQATESYFSAVDGFREAVARRGYKQALRFLRIGLPVTIQAMASMRAKLNGHTPLVPFLGPTAGAVAALFDETEVFDLIEAVNDALQYVDKAKVERYRQDAQLVKSIRATLAIVPETTIGELKRTASRSDQARMQRLLSWMEKNQELGLEGRGKATVVRSGAPTIKPLITYPTFRAGAIAEPAKSYGIPVIESHYFSYDERIAQRNNSDAAKVFSEFEEIFLPAEERQPGAMVTHLLRGGMWLVGASRSKPDGSFLTTVVILTHSGKIIRKVELRHKVVRAFSSYERNQMIILDSILGVHIYPFDGSAPVGFSLATNPEFESVFRLLEERYKATAVVRSVDVSPISGDVAFSVLDKVWRFTGNGESKIALHMQPGFCQPNGSELELIAVASTEVEVAQPSATGLGADWIYFIRFSEVDDSIFVGTYSGHLVRIAADGNVAHTWQLSGPVSHLLEDAEHIVASTYGHVHLLKETGEVKNAEAAGTAFVKAAYTVTRVGREVAVVDNTTLAVTRYLMKRDIKAVYPRNGGLRVDMATTYAELALPAQQPPT